MEGEVRIVNNSHFVRFERNCARCARAIQKTAPTLRWQYLQGRSCQFSCKSDASIHHFIKRPSNGGYPLTLTGSAKSLSVGPLGPNKMVNYDSKCEDDSDGALEKACHNLKGYEFTENDLKFYFGQVELRMRQWGYSSAGR